MLGVGAIDANWGVEEGEGSFVSGEGEGSQGGSQSYYSNEDGEEGSYYSGEDEGSFEGDEGSFEG